MPKPSWLLTHYARSLWNDDAADIYYGTYLFSFQGSLPGSRGMSPRGSSSRTWCGRFCVAVGISSPELLLLWQWWELPRPWRTEPCKAFFERAKRIEKIISQQWTRMMMMMMIRHGRCCCGGRKLSLITSFRSSRHRFNNLTQTHTSFEEKIIK